MTKLSIRGRENGPYMIEAKVRYIDADGEEQVTRGKTVSPPDSGRPRSPNMSRQGAWTSPRW